MKNLLFAIALMSAVTVGALVAQQSAPVSPQALPLAERIVHTEPSKYRPSPSVHGGPGPGIERCTAPRGRQAVVFGRSG
jgi:hypothetical protein